MRIPLTKYGWPQVAILPATALTAMIVYLAVGAAFLPAWATVFIELLLLFVLIGTLAFFRDPYRPVSPDKNILIAPADGKITDIEIVDENDFIGGPSLRIGIFMSVLDVHINRAPCNVKVERINFRQGKYTNAMNPHSGQVNQSNDLALIRTDSPEDRLIVRQISGAIARRIVCEAGQGQELTGGQRFGMVKFGSRTELYVPICENTKCLVKIGDKVKAGISPLVRYEGTQLRGNQ